MSRPAARSARLALPLLVLAALLPYAGTWSHGFVNLDDQDAILNLPLIRRLDLASLPAFFRPDVYGGLPEFMPLKNLSYAVDYAIAGLAPRGFRVQQQLWFVLSVVLAFVWLRALLVRLAVREAFGLDARGAAAVALVVSLWFALHPAHVESVTWLSGRKDVLCGAWFFAALACGLRWAPEPDRFAPGWLAAALVCTALALLSKPMAVVLPLLFALQDVLLAPSGLGPLSFARRRAALWLGALALVGAFAAVYLQLTAPFQAMTATLPGSYAGPAWARWGQQLGAFAYLSLAPLTLVPIYPPDLLDPDPGSWRALGGVAFCVALVAGAWLGRRRPIVLLSIGLFVVPLLPIVFAPPWAQYVANRYLYHAVLGPMLALAWVGARLAVLRPRLARPLVAGAVVLAGSWGLFTVDYNRAWRNGSTLWTSAITVYPEFTRYHELGAGAALDERRPDLAVGLLGRCLEVEPENATCAGMLGGLLLGPDPAQGEALLRTALPRDEQGAAHVRLAQHLAKTGRSREGFELYRAWLHGRSANAAQLGVLVMLALADGRADEAAAYARDAVRAAAADAPASPPPLGVVLGLAQARGDEALRARARVAAACGRADCFRDALGW